MKWHNPTTSTDRWAAKLAEVRAEQPDHPGLAAELWVGDSSTCYSYRKSLKRGMVPSRSVDVPLPVEIEHTGYVFTTRQVGANRRALLAMWVGVQQPLPFELP